jgi:hypothetical protein
MLRIFAALFALCLANSAYAAEADPDTPTDEAHLRWDAPVKNVDDTDLPQCPSDHVEGTPTTPNCLDGFILYWGIAPRDYMANLKLEDQAQRDLIFANQPLDVEYFFALTAYNSSGDESAFSGEVSKTLTEPVGPLPPVVLPVESAVFTVKMQPDTFLLFNVGIVPAGTECFLDRDAPAGYGVVPFVDVVWTDPAGPRPVAVVARCE